MKLKYRFSYGDYPGMTVTVIASGGYHDAHAKAWATMNRRYEKADREPPVGWTFELLSAIPVNRTENR